MPELPEVELARRDLIRWLGAERLVAAEATPGKPLRAGTSPADVAKLSGRRVEAISRRGKHLLWKLEGAVGIHAHLGMTGKFVWRGPKEAVPDYSRVRLAVRAGEVHFLDARRFGRFEIVPAAKLDELPEVAALGPDALDDLPAADALPGALGSPRRPIKLALMDQTALAGLGNIQAAEVLYRAKISPFAAVKKLTPRHWRALHDAIEESLRFTLSEERPPGQSDIRYVEEGGANFFWVYDREGKPCRRKDRTPIKRVTQGARSTYYCPYCQRAP
jgi:formamidopyrimidine-DNA glycosylase